MELPCYISKVVQPLTQACRLRVFKTISRSHVISKNRFICGVLPNLAQRTYRWWTSVHVRAVIPQRHLTPLLSHQGRLSLSHVALSVALWPGQALSVTLWLRHGYCPWFGGPDASLPLHRGLSACRLSTWQHFQASHCRSVRASPFSTESVPSYLFPVPSITSLPSPACMADHTASSPRNAFVRL